MSPSLVTKPPQREKMEIFNVGNLLISVSVAVEIDKMAEDSHIFLMMFTFL